MEQQRNNGVLLHVSSLPSEFGIGDMGEEAYHFIDDLNRYEIKIWQILPLGPVGPGNSPYQSYSAYAGDPTLISPQKLIEWDLLTASDIEKKPSFSNKITDYEKVSSWKREICQKAWERYKSNKDYSLVNEYTYFLKEHDWWLSDYALYAACKIHNDNTGWYEWSEKLKKRDIEELEKTKLEYKETFDFECFQQFLFFRQWFQLKEYAANKNVKILGDIPLYVALDSSDVWANQSIFLLDENSKPTLVGGVPPDYFTEDGQLWGNPVYNWDELSRSHYHWWIARLYFNLHMFNIIRIDHFRGLESFWAVPASSKTAKTGAWMKANGFELLSIMKERLDNLPIVAEDLGIITPEVENLRDHFSLPGMKVLQFAFTSDETNEHLPHHIGYNNIVYTGTHDNDTLVGWWQSQSAAEKKNITQYINARKGNIRERLIELVWSTNAKTAIIPMQDILALGTHARMNIPGTATGNWKWRYQKSQLKKEHWELIAKLNKRYNR